MSLVVKPMRLVGKEGGDLKKKREMFAKQREEMKEAGKLDGLREKRLGQALSAVFSSGCKPSLRNMQEPSAVGAT